MLKKCRRFIYKHSSGITLFLEASIILIALAQLTVLNEDQLESTKAMIQLSKSNAYAIEGIRRSIEKQEPKLLEDAKRRLIETEEIILSYIGRNDPYCITENGAVLRFKLSSDSALVNLANQDMASGTKEFLGQPCKNKLSGGELTKLHFKRALSENSQWLLFTLSILLFWLKIETYLFEKKHPPKRLNEKNIPFYLK